MNTIKILRLLSLAIWASTLAATVSASTSKSKQIKLYKLGSISVEFTNITESEEIPQWEVEIRKGPGSDTLIWKSPVDDDAGFFEVFTGAFSSHEHHQSFDIKQKRQKSCGKAALEEFSHDPSEGSLKFRGSFVSRKKLAKTCPKGFEGKISLSDLADIAMDLQLIRSESKGEEPFHLIRFHGMSSVDQSIYGVGAQMSYLNLKGQNIPALVQEQGITRGRPFLAQLMNTVA